MSTRQLTVTQGSTTSTRTINRTRDAGVKTLVRTTGAQVAGNPQDITAFTISNSHQSYNGTYTKNQYGWERPNGDGSLRFFKDGTRWRFRDYDGEEASSNTVSYDDTEYPWEVSNWLSSTLQNATFGDYVGGNAFPTAPTEDVVVNRTAPVITSDRAGESRPLLSKVVGGAAAAYSLRDLNDKAGNNKVVNVRRDGDNAEKTFLAKEVRKIADWVNGKLENALPADPTSTDADITSFTTVGANDSDYNGTFVKNSSGWQRPNGEGYLRYYKQLGSQPRWRLLSYDGEESDATTLSMDDVQYPWQISNWQISNPPTFQSFERVTNTASAAYSLRKVRTDYTGAAVQIRRTSDNVEVNVAFDSNGEVSTSSAVQGNTTATTLGEFLTEGVYHDATVVTWYDQSGNGYDAMQFTTASQPKIAEAGALLADGIKFDGANDMLQTGTTVIDQTSAGTISHFGVVNVASNEAGYLWGSAGGATNLGTSVYARNDSRFSATSGNATRDTIGRSGGTELVSACYSSGSANLRANGGGTQTSIGGYNFIVNDEFTIGNRDDGPSAPTFLNGSIKEIIVFNSDQSANRFKIESNINNYYGLYTPAYNGFVETWYDQSGNGNDAVQPATGSQPKIVSNGSLVTESGKPAISFDGSNDELQGTTITQPNSYFLAFRHTSSNGRVLSTNLALVGSSSSYRVEYGTQVDTANNSQITTHQLISAVIDGANTTVNQNGVQILAADVGTNSTTLRIGRTVLCAQFNISELITYDSDQSANRPAIEANINNQYSIY